MSQYQSILFIADAEVHHSPGLARAVRLAQLTGAKLRIVIFTYESSIAALGKISSQVMGLVKTAHLLNQEKWLYQHMKALEAQVPSIETDLQWGGPVHEKIVLDVLRTKPDLVVKDVKADKGLKRLLYTPLDWQLLRLCPAPLLLVNESAHVVPRRVIAAVEPTRALRESNHLHDNVVKEAHRLALQCDAAIYLVHAFEDFIPTPLVNRMQKPATDLFERARQDHRNALVEYASHFSVPKERMHMLDGVAAQMIPHFADNCSADVIAVGTTHRVGMERIIMGSTAERLLNAVHCDVLAVKPDGFEKDVRKYLKTTPEAVSRAA